MAIIGKIRKNFWFVLLVLGLALAAFIMMDMTGSSGPGGQVSNLNMGSVAGQKISYKDFQETESAYYRNSGADIYQKRKGIWDFYVENALINKEAQALGLDVSYDEIMELQFGPTPSPIIRNNWTNPQTGQIDINTLNQYKTMIEGDEELPAELKAFWKEQEKHICKEALQTKLYSIVNKAVYTPSWMAEESFKQENSKVDFNFVKIPFDAIENDDIKLTDSDFLSFMNKNKAQYEEKEETRIGQIATFEIEPSEEDKTNLRGSLVTLGNEFLITKDDSLFAVSNRGSYTHIYMALDQIPEVARDSVAALEVGQIFGPFEQEGSYAILKLLDKKVIADSVSAKHILINANRADPTSLANATAIIDSIQRVYKSGSKSFEDLAIEHSQGPSAPKGGDLGTFTQTTMLREFSDVCFLKGQTGKTYTTVTDYGVHLVKVGKKVFNNRDPKYRVSLISQAILPSQETQDNMYDKVSEIVSANRDVASLTTALESENNINLVSTAPLKSNDFTVGTMGSGQTSRDMIIWLFDSETKTGDVSPEIYTFKDKVNYFDKQYVVLSLSDIVPEGLKKVDSVRDQIETTILNQKKGEALASKMSVTSLADIASQYNVDVQNASNISLTSTFVQGAGNEPELIGSAFSLDPQAVSKPIVGNSGVFIVQPISKSEAGAPTNIPFLKTSLATATKSQVNFKIMENLKSKADIDDGRSKFY